jgi:kynurenine formamidase
VDAETRQLVIASRVFDLSQPLDRDTPIHPTHPPYRLALTRRYGDLMRDDGVSGATDMIVTSGHHATHMDALGHMSKDGRLYGGASAQEAATGGWGLTSHSIADVAPIVSEGVLLDVEGFLGRPLEPAEPVTPVELNGACAMGGIQLRRGDTALVRTGWSRHWHDAMTFAGESGGAPGVDLDGARWLVAAGVTLTGSDTMAYEVIAPGSTDFSVHAYLLVEQGINIIEMLNLDELANSGITRFLFIATPLKIVGGTGSPLRPIALA